MAYELICAVYKHAEDTLHDSKDGYPVLRQPLSLEYFWHRPEYAV